MFGFVSKKRYEEALRWADRNQEAFFRAMQDQIVLAEALEEIIENETKGANATVQRMIRIAKNALAELNGEETDANPTE